MSGWLAALGAVTAVLVMLLLLAAGARAALPTTLRSWLLCVAAAVTLFDVIALGFNLVAGGCDAVLSTAVLRPLATVVRPAMRYSPWAPPTLTHTHKPTPCTPCRCPPPPSSTPPSTPLTPAPAAGAVRHARPGLRLRRARRAPGLPRALGAHPHLTHLGLQPRPHTVAASYACGCSLPYMRLQVRADVDQLRRLLLAASLVAVAVPAVGELAEVLRFGATAGAGGGAAAAPLAAAPFCGPRSHAYEIFHGVLNACYSLVIALSLLLTKLAPPNPFAQVTLTPTLTLTPALTNPVAQIATASPEAARPHVLVAATPRV